MVITDRVRKLYGSALSAVLTGLILLGAHPLAAQLPAPQPGDTAAELAAVPLPEPSDVALPIAEDRGQAALEQSLKRLGTTASVLMIVAHPDDEDGALLAYLSRGLGARCTLLTLTRGEGGQNAMSADSYDALGLIRTNELLKADEYYGAKQLWGTEVDFGFSKTQEESFARWGHDRVLYDAVLAVRRERPQIIVSTFVGGITDGHGHHQVSGEIAQEAFKAAGDPKVFPEQLKDGLQPWQPLAVYSRTPFAPVNDGKMFDYATGKWAPARFKNYVTGEWSTDVPSTDVSIPVGTLDPVLGRSYMQIAREGWGEQKSQNGGANPTLSGPATTSYHLWAVAPEAAAKPGEITTNSDLFHNSRVNIDTSLAGLARFAAPNSPETTDSPEILSARLHRLDLDLKNFQAERPGLTEIAAAHKLAAIYDDALILRRAWVATNIGGFNKPGTDMGNPEIKGKASFSFELNLKIEQFQAALRNLVGLDMVAFRTGTSGAQTGGPFRGGAPDETPRSVSPGEEFRVQVHTSQATAETRLNRVWLESRSGEPWKNENITGAIDLAAPTADPIFKVHVPENAEPTEPYFMRPDTEQAYYDLTELEYRERSFAPWPLVAWAEFTFDGLPIRVGQVVQTMQRVLGPGGIYEPLVVTPAIGVRVDPEARILPLNGSALPVRVTVHAQAAADGTVELKLPAGWRSDPAEAHFHLDSAGDTEPILFSVKPTGQPSDKNLSRGAPAAAESAAYTIQAVAHYAGRTYQTGWQSIGYPGLRPYNLYKTAQLKTRKIDVKLVPGLRVGYIMGSGDLVPEAIEALGVKPHILNEQEIVSDDFSTWNILVIGIRAYSVHPELTLAQPRLEQFVRRGGTLIVQYQSGNFPAPFPLSMGHAPERVVDETAPVKLLDPANPLLTWPNAITAADFDGWVEERGHSFLASWDPAYTALTETADPGQDPQRGGLLVAHPGKGTYIYAAYALYRQLPELVPGAYRILANLLSAGENTPANTDQPPAPRP
ncbi:MAG: PIG-L family deacetylase [Terracidiphilus sp.]|jgi:LmbE family N-acetylglucosaminyl deacetylase